jgi:hypothetical protein
MNNVHVSNNASAEHNARRRSRVSEINTLRKFEGKSLIEDKIARNISKLHSLWFKDKSQLHTYYESI